MGDALFAPLTEAERTQPASGPDTFADAVCVIPVPNGTPDPTFVHRDHGKATDTFRYRAANGETLGFVVRFDTPTGIQILRRTLWRKLGGALVWRWKQCLEPRPLINLHWLRRRPDAPILVVEGEKSGRAAHALFADLVATTSPGSSKAARKADWSPVAGRVVVIWPDADQPGAAYAADVAMLVHQTRGVNGADR